MLFVRHLAAVVTDVLIYAARTKRVALVLVVLSGLLLAAVAMAAKASAPFVLYPFV